jgi:hypothetical protein
MSTVKNKIRICKCKQPKSKGLFVNHLKVLKKIYFITGIKEGFYLGIIAGSLGVAVIYFIIKFIYG